MATISNSIVSTNKPTFHLSSDSSGFCCKPLAQSIGNESSVNLSFGSKRVEKLQLSTRSRRRSLTVQAGFCNDGGPSGAGLYVGGFILGGLIVGALGCVYAPQISKVGSEGKDFMKKLPKFIYDEEKALEKTRKVLADNISQLNSAIDDISSQLRPGESDEVGVTI